MTRSKSKKKQNAQNGNQAQKRNIAVECTENIAMLYFLHSVPDQPFTNPVANIKTNGAGYSLPFDEEQSLVSALAFLAQIEDDPDHIPAVCLQEVLDSGSLEVLLAINRKVDTMKWRKYAAKIAMGFEGIAAILRDVDVDSPRNVERKIFTFIIQLCRSRILFRLRFTKKRRDSPDKKRTTIKDGLESVVGYLRENQSNNTKLFLDRARKVIKLADSWENHQTEPPLEALVDGINSLRQTDQYKDILTSIPKTVVDANHVLNMTLKVSRYRECATILSRAARNFPIVRHMQVNLVELPNDVFSRPEVSSNYSPNMHSTISRCQNINDSLKDVNQICKLLQVSAEKAGAQYSEQVKESLTNAKVHAEIQLVYYCQGMEKGRTLPPRVICSSKSACWLCNAFIRFHGKFYMPRCHGKLYPGWRLPNLPGAWSNDIANRFTLCLSGLLTESLKTLYIRKARTRYPDPIESDLSTVKGSSVLSLNSNCLGGFSGEKGSEQLSVVVYSISKATERTTAASPVKTIPEEEIPVEDVPNINTSSEDHASASLVSTVGPGAPTQAEQPDFVVHEDLKSSEQTTTASQEAGISEVEVPVKDAIPGSPTSSKGHTSSSLNSTAISGITTHACVSSGDAPREPKEEARSYDIALGEISPVYTSGPFKLQFEYVSGTRRRGNPRKQLSCTAEWLSPKDAAQLKLEGVIAIDAESLTGDEISHSTDTSDNVYLRLGEAVLRITMRPL
ncbi:hypothetical protein EKO27_g7943 [Xylaria grammica]|uniref:Uncharacterized protein n=1 Tax=Xylaria grammica TaxID=363999 RepID=A0A439CY75_9PEZI|nr:hypothetical protein EKO27_g7943 [Xylaria grammica]